MKNKILIALALLISLGISTPSTQVLAQDNQTIQDQPQNNTGTGTTATDTEDDNSNWLWLLLPLVLLPLLYYLFNRRDDSDKSPSRGEYERVAYHDVRRDKNEKRKQNNDDDDEEGL